MSIKINSFKVLVLLAVLNNILLLSGCIDPISLKVENGEKLLVVDGLFSTSRQHLKLAYTRDFNGSSREYISDAQISIFDNMGNKADYTHIEEGAYQLVTPDFKGEIGATYHLEIQLVDGKIYQTIPQMIPEVVKPAKLNLAIEKEVANTQFNSVENFFIKLYLDTEVKIGKENAYLRWLTDEVYSFQDEVCHPLDNPTNCYVFLQPRQELIILSGKDLSNGIIENILVFSKKLVQKSPEYGQKHAFNIYQLSIPKSAYDYWGKVKRLTNQTGSIFDLPPAGLRGNVFNLADENELVLGFFEVAAIDTIRLFTRPIDFEGKYVFVNYCSNVFPNRFEGDCCDCLLIEGSTLEAPDYW